MNPLTFSSLSEFATHFVLDVHLTDSAPPHISFYSFRKTGDLPSACHWLTFLWWVHLCIGLCIGLYANPSVGHPLSFSFVVPLLLSRTPFQSNLTLDEGFFKLSPPLAQENYKNVCFVHTETVTTFTWKSSSLNDRPHCIYWNQLMLMFKDIIPL